MSLYTDEQIASLITCPKRILSLDRKGMWPDRQFTRQNVKLESTGERQDFTIFLRCSSEFPENFSVGLVYHPKSEPWSVHVFRCNGKHGGTREHPHHAYFHAHIAQAIDLNAGILEPRRIEVVSDYASFRDAQSYFFRRVGIENAEDHFPGIFQSALLFQDGESP